MAFSTSAQNPPRPVAFVKPEKESQRWREEIRRASVLKIDGRRVSFLSGGVPVWYDEVFAARKTQRLPILKPRIFSSFLPKICPSWFSEPSGVHTVKCYSYKELKIATDDFSPTNKIGEGGFGSVFKGKLRNGQMAAIKVLSSVSRQGVREFLTEVQMISGVKHENLVKLYGCCVEGDQRIIVYNYLENNSLAKTLIGGTNSSNIRFRWQTRTKICIGVARGLAYLHEEVRPHIIHRDIKASNILLDEDLNPKISDFGLAKLMPPNTTHVTTRVAGTIGYLAPEYAIRGQVTRKADIYSFGVLLIEIVSGRSNTNTRLPVDEHYILERTWKLYERSELVALVDESLHGDFDPVQACKFLKIGLLCTQDSAKLRPSMSTVVQMLNGDKNVDEIAITKPGLISDFTDWKIRSGTNPKPALDRTSPNYDSSGSDALENTTLTLAPSDEDTTMFSPR
ncbi:probable leucine-rich repeat receptor-like serine/threonine-protein kinase at3g14840 [Phtheirospermum japonicum]|uniref:Probable leucine-rich repeat receptor-like serine/threonine-protein kinase at3g14840 n=1 Tax=Phtheirospermum japonicum TaxID=374723 RepID=A0A830CHX4_9LAMI|nr:probable leucine-rich repeat receptor-like serine/threonine-protein kinase at3g14840 [Phtheirospermum japonicum]